MKIALVGEEILKKLAVPVPIEAIATADFQSFVHELMNTMLNANGIGIAAPQVFDPRAVMIIGSRPNPRYPQAPEMAPLVLINPQISQHSSEQLKDWEGCLSVPALRGNISRYKWVELDYVDAKGKPQSRRLEGFVARIFQHEFDHLIGKTWLDHVTSSDDIMADSVWQEWCKTQSDKIIQTS